MVTGESGLTLMSAPSPVEEGVKEEHVCVTTHRQVLEDWIVI